MYRLSLAEGKKTELDNFMALVSPINDFLGAIADRGLALLGVSNNAQNLDVEATVDLCSRLLSSRGNASGLALSYKILKSYDAFSKEDKLSFFQYIISIFSCDLDAAETQASAFLKTKSSKDLEKLSKTTTPRYAEFISRLNQAPSSTMPILNMRSDLLGYLRKNPDLRPLDSAFVQVFSAWFNRGFLGLRSINWATSATILENIIKYEAVHGIADWDDLGRRIKPADRLIYGFFHPNLEDEPLIFVEVALTLEMPDAIGPILSEDRSPVDPKKATTAVFYSISNCQNGLRGIPLGNFLIKQVVEDLRIRFPHLKEFVTLSPVVKFGDWVRSEPDYTGLRPETVTDALYGSDITTPEVFEQTMMPAMAWFLSNQKAKDGKPVDPVCRFHIGNGARLERVNWAARIDENGFDASYTIMVNYKYIIDDIEKNHEAFESDGTVTIAPAIKKLAAQSKNAKIASHK